MLELLLPEADVDKYAKNSSGAIYGVDVDIKADKVTMPALFSRLEP